VSNSPKPISQAIRFILLLGENLGVFGGI